MATVGINPSDVAAFIIGVGLIGVLCHSLDA